MKCFQRGSPFQWRSRNSSWTMALLESGEYLALFDILICCCHRFWKNKSGKVKPNPTTLNDLPNLIVKWKAKIVLWLLIKRIQRSLGHPIFFTCFVLFFLETSNYSISVDKVCCFRQENCIFSLLLGYTIQRKQIYGFPGWKFVSLASSKTETRLIWIGKNIETVSKSKLACRI